MKYPPLWPLVLAGVWKASGGYPAGLPALKAANAFLWAACASLAFLLVAGGAGAGARHGGSDGAGRDPDRGDRARLGFLAAAAAFGFLSVPSLSIATTLLSEPLFLVLTLAAILAAGRAAEEDAGGAARVPGEERRSWRAGWRRGAWWTAAGTLAAAASLTRSVGIAVAAAIALAALAGGPARARLRRVSLALAAPAAAAAAWLAWTASAAGAVPEVAAGQYGAYAAWYLEGFASDPLSRTTAAVAAAWPALVSTLTLLWAPGAPPAAALLAIALLGGCAAYGGWRGFRRRPALPLFLLLYLGIVFLWPYEPDRFLWTVHPLLTLLVVRGIAAALPSLRADVPRFGVPAAAVGLAALALNTLGHEARGYGRRAWELPQRAPAAAFAPLATWIREHAPPDAVIASRLDPYLYWQTGRRSVPSWRFSPEDHAREERDPAVLAADFEAVRTAFAPDYVAVAAGENKAWLTAVAYAERNPGRVELAFEAEGEGPAARIYRLLGPERGDGAWPEIPDAR